MRALKPQKINFIQRLGEQPERNMASRRQMKFMMPIAAILLVVLLAEGLLLYQLHATLYDKRDSLSEYLSDADVLENYKNAVILTAQRDELLDRYDNLELLADHIQTYPIFDSRIYHFCHQQANAMGVTIESFGFEQKTGMLTLNCISDAVSSPARFAQAMRQSDWFSRIDYAGYSQTGQKSYLFSISCIMNQRGEAAK